MKRPRTVSRAILASSRTIRKNWCRLTSDNNPKISVEYNYLEGSNLNLK